MALRMNVADMPRPVAPMDAQMASRARRAGQPAGRRRHLACSLPSLGTVGYATRRDPSSWFPLLFEALLALLVFGIAAIFISISHANVT